MFNAKSDHFSPKIKLYIYENRKSNANDKIKTDSRLMHLIDFIFYKILGSDTL